MGRGGSFVENYFKQQLYYEEKYGQNTVVLIQKGSFYEIYGINNENESIGKAKEISSILNISLTSANKSIQKCDMSNPNMTGIPQTTLKKYLKILNDNNYTTVVIDQDTDDNTKREVSQIYSPGTYDEDSQESLNICGIYYTSDFNLYICSIDISIGTCNCYEVIHGDNHSKLEELYRIIHSCTPRETVLFKSNNRSYESKIEEVLHNPKIISINTCVYDPNYIVAMLNKVYGQPCIFDLRNESKINLCLLIEYIYDHNEQILEIIKEPCIGNSENFIIYNNGIHQLNVLNPHGQNTNKSLYDMLCRCSTQMGKRLFKRNITSPYNNHEYLNECYDNIETMIKCNKLNFYNEKLKHINDVERVFLKLKTGKLNTQEFKELVYSCKIMHEVLYEYKNNNSLKEFNEYMEMHVDIYNIDFFRKELYSDLDKIAYSIQSCEKWINTLCEKLSKYINVKGQDLPVKYDSKNQIIYTTPTRGKLLSKAVFDNYGTLIYKNDKTKCVINSTKIDTKLHELTKSINKFKTLEETLFKEFCLKVYNDYKDIIFNATQELALLDLYVNHALLAIDYNYCKPRAIASECAFIDAKDLRHGLIELLDQDTEYVPNNVYINPNDKNKGILLYGFNGSGKSCYSKSIGIALIMAQMGMYTPCSSFTFSPYTKLFTRLNCDDNLFKGQSSFFVEMSELRSIMNYIDNKSIVLGDEICKGTESVSGLSIVGCALCNLLEKNVSFVFATHLHKLPELSCLKNVEGLNIKHIQVEFDKNNDFLKYTRKLCDGPCDSVYGLEIANYILQNPEFFKVAYNIRNEIIAKPKLLSAKKSKYNTGLFVDSCEICKSSTSLDVHHIEHQKISNANIGKKTTKTKNNKSNLVTLCKQCHNDHHNGKLEIKGWVKTSNGTILDYVKI